MGSYWNKQPHIIYIYIEDFAIKSAYKVKKGLAFEQSMDVGSHSNNG